MTPFEAFIAFFRDLALRLKAKNPKFFNILQWICSFITVSIGLLLYLNTQYEFGWGLILVFGKIPLTAFLGMIATFFAGVFIASQIPVSDKSIYKDKLSLDKKNEPTSKPDKYDTQP